MKTMYLGFLGCLASLMGLTELSAGTCVSLSFGCLPVCAPMVCVPACRQICAPAVCAPVCVNPCNPCCDYVEYDYSYTAYNYRRPAYHRQVHHVTNCTTYVAPRDLYTRGCIRDLFNWNCNGTNGCGVYNSSGRGVIQSITLSQDNASYRCNGERNIYLNMQFNLDNNWQACRIQEQLNNLCCTLRDRLCCEPTLCNNYGNVQFSAIINYGDLEVLAGCLKSFSYCANLPHEAIQFFNELSSECCRYQNHYCYNH